MSLEQQQENPFAISFVKMEVGNYLGDYEVVNSMLRMEADEFIKRQRTGRNKERVAEVCAAKLVKILMGRDRRYEEVAKWNKPGGIDRFLKKWVGSSETKPRLIMKHAAVVFLSELMDVILLAGRPRATYRDIKPALDDFFKRWTNLIIGIPPNSPVIVDKNASN